MLISISTNNKETLPIQNSNKSVLDSAGFTLIEILVALFLVTIILGVVLMGTQSNAQQLDETTNHIERSVRFGNDEAALRNVMVRVRFVLTGNSQEISVEYGPDSYFIPPPRQNTPLSQLVGSERELYEAQLEEVNKKFNRIRGLQEGAFEVPENVVIMGLGFPDANELTVDGEYSLYIYPTGEREHTLIILSTEDEFVLMEVDPFLERITKSSEAHQFSFDLEKRYTKAQELFKQWVSNL